MFFVSLGDGDNVEMLSEHHTAITYNAQSQAGGKVAFRLGGFFTSMDRIDRIGDGRDFGESRSIPLISVHMSKDMSG